MDCCAGSHGTAVLYKPSLVEEVPGLEAVVRSVTECRALCAGSYAPPCVVWRQLTKLCCNHVKDVQL